MNKPQFIIPHHSAVSREKNSEQFDAIDGYHLRKGWGGIGYHYLIEPDGTLKAGREENQSGAHCYQEGMNYKSIGICLTGNFDEEEPTKEQLKTLKELVAKLRKKYLIPAENVKPHRHFAPKSCPGKNLTDEMISELAKGDEDLPKWIKDLLKDFEDAGVTTNPHTEIQLADGSSIPLYQVWGVLKKLVSNIK